MRIAVKKHQSGGIYVALEQLGVGAAERAAVLVPMAVMVLVAAIWQSTGPGVARVHTLHRWHRA